MQSSSRNGAKVIWLCLHTTEGMMRAKDLRDWKSWAGSSHASNDETGVLMTPADGFVPYDRAAWTLRNGNPISENLEQCGWAKWTRTEWLSRDKLLNTTALWLADRSRARGIPLRLLTPDEIRSRKVPGVLGHGDYSTATGDGTHWDPGKGFPWDVVLAKARWLLNPTPIAPPEDELSAAEVKQIVDPIRGDIGYIRDQIRGDVGFIRDQILAQLSGLQQAVVTLAEAAASGRDDLTADQLKAAVKDAIMDAGAALRATETAAS